VRRAFVEIRFGVRDDESGLHFAQVGPLDPRVHPKAH
jgi:hypothetical protein